MVNRGLAYLIAPADGPCYAALVNESTAPDTRQHIQSFNFPVIRDIPDSYVNNYRTTKIWKAKSYQELLWRDRYLFFSKIKLPGVFYGIAAMPSLHVAAVTMLAIFLCKTNIVFALLGIIFAILTFIGSIFLQWHYAIDGYLGFIMACLVCFVSLRISKLTPKPYD